MRITVSRESLAAPLATVVRAAKANSPVTALAGVLVRGGQGEVELTATDLDLTIQARLAASVDGEGAVVLPARHFLEIVKRLPGDDVAMDIEGHKAVVRAGMARFTLHGIPASTFPQLPRVASDAPRVTMLAGVLREVFRRTVYAAAPDVSRPILTGVALRAEGHTLRAIATDTFRIAAVERAGGAPGDIAPTVIPSRSLDEVLRLLKDDEEEVTVTFSGALVAFAVGRVTVVTRVLDGEYPNVLSMLPTVYPRRLVVRRQALVDALERADLLVSGLASHVVVLETGPEGVVVRAENPELGAAQDEVEGTYEGEPLRVGFNVRYLLDGLRVMDGEDVEMGLTDHKGAARLRSVEDDSFTYFVLPVLIQDQGQQAEGEPAVVAG